MPIDKRIISAVYIFLGSVGFSQASYSDDLNGCSAVFPGAVQTFTKKGVVKFKKNAQILNTPDATLATSLIKVKEQSLLTCGDAQCVSTGAPSQPFTTLVFKSKSSSLKYIYEDAPKDLVIGSSSNAIKKIKLKKGGSVKFTGGHKEYFIKKLEIKNGTISLPAADYWIEKLELENTRLTVDGAGTVRLFIKKELEVERNSLINSQEYGEPGNSNQLLVYSYGKVEIGDKSTFSGLVYANNKIEIDNYSQLFGAISSVKIELEKYSKVTYAARNLATAYLDGLCNSPLLINILKPKTLITVASSPVTLNGIINNADATLTVNGESVTQNSGLFSANVNLEQGLNNIVARAVSDDGQVVTSSIAVYLDVTPPYITVESPKEGQVVNTPDISVTGLVNDIVRGTISEQQANVVVNGIQAVVKNRSYLAENIPLTEGSNIITILASDEVGNTSTKSINVVYQPITGQHIALVSGQNQTAQIQSILTTPITVKILDANNNPVVNKNVVFRVIQGSGVLAPGTSSEGQGALVKTDANGLATTTFKLGSRAGVGNHRVRAKAVGFEGEVIFLASADQKPANKLSVNSGNNQRAAISQPLPQPFVVVVTDDGSNVLPGVEIEFTVTKGSGTFVNGGALYRAVTDSDGRATAQFTLGPESGLDFHRVTASIVGTNFSSIFTASALVPGDPGNTSISGLVLDNQDNPVPNVTIRIDGTTRQAVTNAQGQFTITNTPVGPVHLMVDGSTTTLTGEWPTLSYNLVTVAGASNSLPAPIYILPLKMENSVEVGMNDVELTVPELPGFKLSIKGGSATFPDGSKTGRISVTPVNSAKLPMVPPNGMQPQFIVTIQPVGTRFDPPAQVTLPNVDAHPPGAQVDMFSYDHDLEEFVTIGVGTVSKDGGTIVSNPGVGVIKAGWFCGAQPGGSGCCSGPSNCTELCTEPNPDCDAGCSAIPDCVACDPVEICTGCTKLSVDGCGCDVIPQPTNTYHPNCNAIFNELECKYEPNPDMENFKPTQCTKCVGGLIENVPSVCPETFCKSSAACFGGSCDQAPQHEGEIVPNTGGCGQCSNGNVVLVDGCIEPPEPYEDPLEEDIPTPEPPEEYPPQIPAPSGIIEIPIVVRHKIPADHIGVPPVFPLNKTWASIGLNNDLCSNGGGNLGPIANNSLAQNSLGRRLSMNQIIFTGDNSRGEPENRPSTHIEGVKTYRAKSYVLINFDTNDNSVEIVSTPDDFKQPGDGNIYERGTSVTPTQSTFPTGPLICIRSSMTGTCLEFARRCVEYDDLSNCIRYEGPPLDAFPPIIPDPITVPTKWGTGCYNGNGTPNAQHRPDTYTDGNTGVCLTRAANGSVSDNRAPQKICGGPAGFRSDISQSVIRLSDNRFLLKMKMKNFLQQVTVQLDVNWEFEIEFDVTDRNNIKYEIKTGEHDLFPLYEVFVGDQLIYGYNGIIAGGSPLLLGFPPENIYSIQDTNALLVKPDPITNKFSGVLDERSKNFIDCLNRNQKYLPRKCQ